MDKSLRWELGALALGALLALPTLSAAADAPAAPTFSKDVAPIFQAKCQSCHEPGSIAPMSLVTFQDARPWARSIRAARRPRQMPPWHIDRSVGVQKFKNDMSLTDEQVDTIVELGRHGRAARRTRPICRRPSRSRTSLYWQAEARRLRPARHHHHSRASRRCRRSTRMSGGGRWSTSRSPSRAGCGWWRSVRRTSRAARSCTTRSRITVLNPDNVDAVNTRHRRPAISAVAATPTIS